MGGYYFSCGVKPRDGGEVSESLHPSCKSEFKMQSLTGDVPRSATTSKFSSSILDASSAAPSTSSRGGKSSSSPSPSSSSSMLNPSLIMRWIRPANCVGSSRLKPDVSKDVSNNSQIKSFTVLSDLSAEAFFFNSDMMECFGFTSMVFLETIYDVIELSRRA